MIELGRKINIVITMAIRGIESVKIVGLQMTEHVQQL